MSHVQQHGRLQVQEPPKFCKLWESESLAAISRAIRASQLPQNFDPKTTLKRSASHGASAAGPIQAARLTTDDTGNITVGTSESEEAHTVSKQKRMKSTPSAPTQSTASPGLGAVQQPVASTSTADVFKRSHYQANMHDSDQQQRLHNIAAQIAALEPVRPRTASAAGQYSKCEQQLRLLSQSISQPLRDAMKLMSDDLQHVMGPSAGWLTTQLSWQQSTTNHISASAESRLQSSLLSMSNDISLMDAGAAAHTSVQLHQQLQNQAVCAGQPASLLAAPSTADTQTHGNQSHQPKTMHLATNPSAFSSWYLAKFADAFAAELDSLQPGQTGAGGFDDGVAAQRGVLPKLLAFCIQSLGLAVNSHQQELLLTQSGELNTSDAAGCLTPLF
eukprot:jgi/Chrzof1/14832/Cz09g17280.t1